MRRWGVACIAFCVVLVPGCANNQARPSTVVAALPTVEKSSPSLHVVDARTPESKVERMSKDVKPMLYLGDASIVPAPAEVLAAHTANALPPRLRESVIELTRFDVGLVTNGSYLSGVGTVSPLPNINPGAYVLGNVLGAALVAGLRAASGQGPRTSAYADVAARIDGVDFSGVEFVDLTDGLSAEQALAKAISGAIQYLLYEAGRQTPALSPQ